MYMAVGRQPDKDKEGQRKYKKNYMQLTLWYRYNVKVCKTDIRLRNENFSYVSLKKMYSFHHFAITHYN